MSTVDIILILCFLPAMLEGITKGVVAQVTAIFSIILGVWLSFRFSAAVSAWLCRYMEVSPQLMQILSFILIMMVVSLALYAVSKLIQGILKLVMLSWLDKLLGVIFSFLKACLIVGLLIMLFNTLNSGLGLVDESVLDNSILYGPLKNFAYTVFPYFKDLLFMQ